MPGEGLLLELLDVVVELGHLVLPLLIEAVELVEVGCLDLLSLDYSKHNLVCVPFLHLLLGPPVQLLLELFDSFLGGVGLDVLPVLLAGLLVVVQDLAE